MSKNLIIFLYISILPLVFLLSPNSINGIVMAVLYLVFYAIIMMRKIYFQPSLIYFAFLFPIIFILCPDKELVSSLGALYLMFACFRGSDENFPWYIPLSNNKPLNAAEKKIISEFMTHIPEGIFALPNSEIRRYLLQKKRLILMGRRRDGHTSFMTKVFESIENLTFVEDIQAYLFKTERPALTDEVMNQLCDKLKTLSFLEGLIIRHVNLKHITFPQTMTNFKHLHLVEFNNTQLDSLPKNLDQFTKLRWLNLSRNNLTTLPQESAFFNEIHGLILNENKFNFIPEFLIELPKLEQLDFMDNQLVSLPNKLCNPDPKTAEHKDIRLVIDGTGNPGLAHISPEIWNNMPLFYNIEFLHD